MPKVSRSKGKAKPSNPETTLKLIESIVNKEGLKVRPFSYGQYFSPHFSAIREHFLLQGKFRDFVRLVVDLGLLARKADREFLQSIKNEDENIVIRYGEASLRNLDSKEMDEVFIPNEDEVEFLQETALDSVQPEDVDDFFLEFAVRLLRCNKKYRVCFVPDSGFVHSLSIYPFLIEMIYAIAEDLDKDKELFETMVKLYSSSVIRYHEKGNFNAFYAIKNATISYLTQKNVRLIFATGVLDTLRSKVEVFSNELSMDDLPFFVETLESGKDFILINRCD